MSLTDKHRGRYEGPRPRVAPPRILLLGASGQVGSHLADALAPAGEVRALKRAEADFLKPRSALAAVSDFDPQVVVNAAAWTKVDLAESNVEEAFLVNSETPGLLAGWAAGRGALFVHFSTDYVFDGEKKTPYDEDDQPAPINAYGASKLAGEKAVARAGGDHLIFRTSWVFSPRGENFPRTILRLAETREELSVNDDQVGAPTSADFLADMASMAVQRHFGGRPAHSGVYHLAGSGRTSWFGYANYLVERAPAAGFQINPRLVVRPTYGPDPSRPARRPLNSLLDSGKFARTFNLTPPGWEDMADGFLTLLADRGPEA
ncbi:MAG: dTDP-4-dehydrorhamnose reductase [Deltaproteobacteria bacterium]|nr:dTDP-4-dehydrorhamnose reductase [Deltaproteobacteria bacterium]